MKEFINAEQEKLRRALSMNIKIRRKLLGISQEKLAEYADLSAQTVNDIEGCRMWVSDKTIIKLSQALQVDAYQLLIPSQTPVALSESELESLASSPAEILLLLQENIKRSIDAQFNKVLKSGILK
jgi:transcriptional regulator with XRE-family HTH domain